MEIKIKCCRPLMQVQLVFNNNLSVNNNIQTGLIIVFLGWSGDFYVCDMNSKQKCK